MIAAPVFHAWGFGQMAISSTMTCTMIMARRFDPQGTLDLVRKHSATGLAVVPVMLERIIDLPAEVLDARPTPSLRFVTASGSRMRTEALLAFMDRYGDIVYNSYNATEAGLISTATPADMRIAPRPPVVPSPGRTSGFSTTTTTCSAPTRSDGSSWRATPDSTATPPATLRRSPETTWSPATSAASTATDCCSWWAATTR